MTTIPAGNNDKTKRPISVWLLTIYALLFAGIVPLIFELVLLSSDRLRVPSDENHTIRRAPKNFMVEPEHPVEGC